jgi:hypothetical protein
LSQNKKLKKVKTNENINQLLLFIDSRKLLTKKVTDGLGNWLTIKPKSAVSLYYREERKEDITTVSNNMTTFLLQYLDYILNDGGEITDELQMF